MKGKEVPNGIRKIVKEARQTLGAPRSKEPIIVVSPDHGSILASGKEISITPPPGHETIIFQSSAA